jgi:hypothetical protein
MELGTMGETGHSQGALNTIKGENNLVSQAAGCQWKTGRWDLWEEVNIERKDHHRADSCVLWFSAPRNNFEKYSPLAFFFFFSVLGFEFRGLCLLGRCPAA